MLVGASLSLSGRFQRQGEEARDGLQLWADYARTGGSDAAPRLIVLDDRSQASLAREHAQRLLGERRVDILAGPYSSGLVLAVAPVAAAAGAVLWNHGGASDAIVQAGGRHVVSVPSPASEYLRDLPGWLRRRAPGARRLAILHAEAGTFARQVARGAAEGARAAGFDEIRVTAFASPVRDAGRLLREVAAGEPDLVVGVGAFPDDVAIARQRALLPARTVLAVVGAGLAAFGDEVGDLTDGIVGPSQWEPVPGAAPQVGPDSAWFVDAFRRAFHRTPEYPAAQAFALGVIVEACRRRAGGRLAGPALFEAAHALDTTTLYGAFRLEPATGRQIGHRVRLIEWHGGRKRVVGDPDP